MTTLFKNKNTGEILDADIVFNSVNYTWGDLVAFPDTATGNTVDFQNALTHELGHVLGLDHSCYAPADDQPRLSDHTGAPEVDCYGNPFLPEVVADSTMYPSVSLADTRRRDLAADDAQGVCDIYPYLHESCPVPSDDAGGCATLAGPSDGDPARPWAGWVTTGMAAGLLGLVYRRRTRRTRS